MVATTCGAEKVKLHCAFTASADGTKLPVLILVPRKKSLPFFVCPDNVIVHYQQKGNTFNNQVNIFNWIEHMWKLYISLKLIISNSWWLIHMFRAYLHLTFFVTAKTSLTWFSPRRHVTSIRKPRRSSANTEFAPSTSLLVSRVCCNQPMWLGSNPSRLNTVTSGPTGTLRRQGHSLKQETWSHQAMHGYNHCFFIHHFAQTHDKLTFFWSIFKGNSMAVWNMGRFSERSNSSLVWSVRYHICRFQGPSRFASARAWKRLDARFDYCYW